MASPGVPPETGDGVIKSNGRKSSGSLLDGIEVFKPSSAQSQTLQEAESMPDTRLAAQIFELPQPVMPFLGRGIELVEVQYMLTKEPDCRLVTVIGPGGMGKTSLAIQAAAGVAAIISAFPELSDIKVEITLAVIILLTFVNLRGVKDAGLIFVLPSYLFMFSMFTVFGFGIYRHINGTLPSYATQSEGLLPLGESQGLISLAAALLILKAFANGSASLTGLEAVSDSVPLFKSPEHKNARTTLTLMALTLGTLITGIAWLAQKTTAVPYAEGTPTVISLVAKAALGDSAFGNIFFYIVQAGTTFILFAGANTCYNAFPNLVSVVAKDGFLPKRLTQRGHRLAFSNGIIFITGGASILVIVSGASITALAAIYALAVFVGFAITGLGMARKTLR
jgi:amino acid transporter